MSYYLAVTAEPCDEALAVLKTEVGGALIAKIAPSAFVYYFPGESGAFMPGLEALKRFEIIVSEVTKEFAVCSLQPEAMDALRRFNHERANVASAEGQVPM